MTSANDAQEIVLRRVNAHSPPGHPDEFVIQSCELSARADYWVVRANSRDFVVHGLEGRMYVGVNAYLVSTCTGAIEIVGSGQSVDSYLQDKYDCLAAGEQHYVLGPVFGRADKAALIHLRQQLGCSLQDTIGLLSAPENAWIRGRLRTLKATAELFQQHGISVDIALKPGYGSAIEIDDAAWHWGAVQREMQRLIRHLNNSAPSDGG